MSNSEMLPRHTPQHKILKTTVATLSVQLLPMIRERQAGLLDSLLKDAEESGIAELGS
jgi:hypothetical protein